MDKKFISSIFKSLQSVLYSKRENFSNYLFRMPIWTKNSINFKSRKKQVFFVPTFDTKVTEYLCSGWVFFSSDKFRLFS